MSNKFATYICYLNLIMFAMVMTVISPLLPVIAGAFSLSMGQSGIFFTANSLGYIPFVLAGGVLADKFGKKQVLFVALAGLSVSLFLFAGSQDMVIACITMFFIGGFGGVIETISSALVSDVNPERPDFYINLAHMFLGLGALSAPLAAGLLITNGVSWRLCYYVIAVFAVALTIVAIFIKAPSLTSNSSINFKGIKNLITDRNFLLLCLCMVCYTGAEVGSWGWMSTFLKNNMGFSTNKSSLAVSVFWLAMAVGRLLCSFLTLRFRLGNIILTLAAISSVVTVISGLPSNEAVLWVVLAAMGLAYSSQWPLIVSYGGIRYNSNSGTVFALLIASGGIGNTIIPYCMGVIGENFGSGIAMMSPSILFVIIVAVFLLQKKDSSACINT